jgi:hypothetical protein
MEKRNDESREERVEDVLVKLGEEVTLDCEASQRYGYALTVYSTVLLLLSCLQPDYKRISL